MSRYIKALLWGLGLGIGGYFIKDLRMNKELDNKEQFAKDIIAEINRLTVDKNEVKEATYKAAEITEIIDEYTEGVKKNDEYAKTIAKLAVKRIKKQGKN